MMDEPQGETTMIGQLLGRLRAGDGSARDELLSLACVRLTRLARKMLRSYPGVARWEQTDDVLQNAAIRLCRALKELTLESPRSFFNLAAVQMRRELIDLARHHYGPRGIGAHHESVGPSDTRRGPAFDCPATETDEPGRLADWTEFHDQVDALSDEQREVFNLVWYQGLSQADTAALLGVTERVVKWRWRAARLTLRKAVNGEPPK
jgi:RNA polymerase sigma-70 factor (ECF subfamily)